MSCFDCIESVRKRTFSLVDCRDLFYFVKDEHGSASGGALPSDPSTSMVDTYYSTQIMKVYFSLFDDTLII